MNYIPTHDNHKLRGRLLSALLIVCLLLPMADRAAMYGQSDDPQGNAPLNVPFGPVLFIIETTGQTPPADLPPTTVIHTRLEEPGRFYWIASGAAEDANLLAATGLAVTTLDADTTGAIYYIADGAAPHAATLAASVGEVIWQQATYLMVATDADHELALVETLPLQGISISLLAPLPLTVEESPVAAAALPAAATVADPAITALLSQITPQALQTLVNQLSGETPAPVGGAAVTINTRYTFASRLRSAEQFVYEYYQALGLNVRYAPWTYGKYSGRNVVAEVRGSTQPERVLLVGGHLDDTSNIPYTTAPGADNNATGSAATMLLARLLANYRPAITVRFVHFTGEEQGQWGSKIYASALRQAGEQVVGFFDLDMIGWDGNNDRVVEIHTGSGPKSNALADQYLERNDRYGGGLIFERKSSTASRFSDHSPFWDNNIASFLIIENFFVDARPNDRNPYYHNTGDLASRVNFDYVARIARVTLATLVELAEYDLTGTPATATPTATATALPLQTATPVATATPGACTNLLVNGDFESSGGWQFGSTPYPGRYTTAAVYSGAAAVQLGIPTGVANRRAYSTVFQKVTIPANAAAPVLLRYVERSHGAADNADYRETLLLNSSYGYLARLTRSTAAGDGAWREQVFDVTIYRGRTLVVYFNVYNDGLGSQMWSFLDRVELGSCVSANSPDEPTPTASITPTAISTATSTVTPTATSTVTPTVTPEPTATAPLTPTLALVPREIYLGALFGSEAVTVTVQLGEQRSGFAWEATTEAPWLQLEPATDDAGEVLRVAALPGLDDGVYTATIHSKVTTMPDLAIDAPVTYVQGEVQFLYLPAIVNQQE